MVAPAVRVNDAAAVGCRRPVIHLAGGGMVGLPGYYCRAGSYIACLNRRDGESAREVARKIVRVERTPACRVVPPGGGRIVKVIAYRYVVVGRISLTV